MRKGDNLRLVILKGIWAWEDFENFGLGKIYQSFWRWKCVFVKSSLSFSETDMYENIQGKIIRGAAFYLSMF